MFKIFLKITLRNMARHRGFTFINIAGLTIGIAVCFLLSLWVNDELSYDRFHEHADRIYRSQWEARYGDNEWKMPLVPMPLAAALEDGFPEVEKTTQVYQGGLTFQKDGQQIREPNILFVDEDFFTVFSVEVVSGDPEKAIGNTNAVLLTTTTAARYFGDKNPLGQELFTSDGKALQVAAIVKSFPPQSHLQFDILGSLQYVSRLERRKEQWGSATLFTYSLLQEGTDYHAFNDKFHDWVNKNIAGEDFSKGNNFTRFPLEPITDIHWIPNRSYIWMFSIIAVLILLLACINFINLATARAVHPSIGSRCSQSIGFSALSINRTPLCSKWHIESLLHIDSCQLLA